MIKVSQQNHLNTQFQKVKKNRACTRFRMLENKKTCLMSGGVISCLQSSCLLTVRQNRPNADRRYSNTKDSKTDEPIKTEQNVFFSRTWTCFGPHRGNKPASHFHFKFELNLFELLFTSERFCELNMNTCSLQPVVVN